MPRSTPYRDDRPSVVELSGGGLVRRRSDGHLLLLHDPSEDRWSLPKGHVEPGETIRAAAAREITEETGLTDVALGPERAEVHYRFYQAARDRNVLKTVVYYEGVSDGGPLTLEPIFDEARWMPLTEAVRLVRYDDDRRAISALLPSGAAADAPPI